jgi:hypothetical protein
MAGKGLSPVQVSTIKKAALSWERPEVNREGVCRLAYGQLLRLTSDVEGDRLGIV